MNQDIIQGKWNEMKGKIKQQWGKLNDDDVAQIKGSYDELIGRLQKNYGYNKDQANHEINEFLRKNDFLD